MMALRLPKRMRGMTLVELLTVVCIIGILMSIGVPSYRRYMLRSQRSEAKIALMQLQTAQEKFYMQNNAYTDKVTTATNAASPGLGLSGVSETQKYNITVALATGSQSYTATATPKVGGGQTDDKECANYTITERGVRGVSGTKTPEYCWK